MAGEDFIEVSSSNDGSISPLPSSPPEPKSSLPESKTRMVIEINCLCYILATVESFVSLL